jgi:hypothetical protein
MEISNLWINLGTIRATYEYLWLDSLTEDIHYWYMYEWTWGQWAVMRKWAF